MAGTSKAKGIPVIVWVLIGCGCLGFGIIVLGFIGVIALPGFLNQSSGATEAQVRVFVMSAVRYEQAYFWHNGHFTDSFNKLGIVTPPETNYQYRLVQPPGQPETMMITATPKQSGLRSFTGGVFFETGSGKETIGQVCQSISASMIPPDMPSPPNSQSKEPECPVGSQSTYSKR